MASVTSPMPESNFAKAYLHLLHMSREAPVFSDTHVAARPQPSSLCILSKMPAAKKQTKRVSSSLSSSSSPSEGAGTPAGAAGSRLIKVTVKSIKAPKFVLTMDDVPASETVLDLKQRIVKLKGGEMVATAGDAAAAAAAANVNVNVDAAASIRLLVKGKVMQDSKSLDAVAGDDDAVSFMAMISAVPAAAAPPAQVDADPEIEPPQEAAAAAATAPVEISAGVWAEIGQVLHTNLGAKSGAEALLKLKHGWEASK